MLWIVRLYPRAWRALYEEEFRAVLEDQRPTLASVLDVAAGALDAHLHLDERTGRTRSPLATLQATTLTVLCAYAVCVVALLHFGSLIDDGPYAFNMAAGHPGPLLELDLANPLSAAADLLAVGALSAAIFLFIGGAPLAITAWTRAPQRRRLFLGPPLAGVAMLVPPMVNLVAHVLSKGAVSTTVLFTAGTPLGTAFTAWIIVCAGAGTVAIVHALGREALDERRLRFAYLPSVGASASLVVITAATISWGVAAHLRAPTLFDAMTLWARHATVLWWVLIVALMAGASATAVRAVLRSAPLRAPLS
jgi:hypothetical protein